MPARQLPPEGWYRATISDSYAIKYKVWRCRLKLVGIHYPVWGTFTDGTKGLEMQVYVSDDDGYRFLSAARRVF